MQEQDLIIHYYLESSLQISTTLGLQEFYFIPISIKLPVLTPTYLKICPKDYIALHEYMTIHRGEKIEGIEIVGICVLYSTHTKVKMRTCRGDYYLLRADIAAILAINFNDVRQFQPQLIPKFIDSHKTLHYLGQEADNALLEIETFPYLSKKQYLNIQDFDINKHSLILGASGTGKSKLLSSMITCVINDDAADKKYKFLVIDPHASLHSEIGALGNVIDFQNKAIDLFANDVKNPVLSVELLLEVFKGLLEDSWNSRLERVLRHSFYLLNITESLSFSNLRRVLLSLPYRSELLGRAFNLPASTVDFFQMEYTEIKNRYYAEAVAPIVALIDEIEIIPAFTTFKHSVSISDCLFNHDLSLISLSSSQVGYRGTQIIAGLIMQQLMNLVQNYKLNFELILIVDETAVVANPVLARMLAEARKFGLHLVLVGQYFSIMPEYLRTAILANVSNYFLFRISKDDAETFAPIINMKVPLDNTHERRVQILNQLNDRECVIRLSIEGKLQPAIKGVTTGFSGIQMPANRPIASMAISPKIESVEKFTFSVATNFTLQYILNCFSIPSARQSCESLEKQLIRNLAEYTDDHKFNFERSIS